MREVHVNTHKFAFSVADFLKIWLKFALHFNGNPEEPGKMIFLFHVIINHIYHCCVSKQSLHLYGVSMRIKERMHV